MTHPRSDLLDGVSIGITWWYDHLVSPRSRVTSSLCRQRAINKHIACVWKRLFCSMTAFLVSTNKVDKKWFGWWLNGYGNWSPPLDYELDPQKGLIVREQLRQQRNCSGNVMVFHYQNWTSVCIFQALSGCNMKLVYCIELAGFDTTIRWNWYSDGRVNLPQFWGAWFTLIYNTISVIKDCVPPNLIHLYSLLSTFTLNITYRSIFYSSEIRFIRFPKFTTRAANMRPISVSMVKYHCYIGGLQYS